MKRNRASRVVAMTVAAAGLLAACLNPKEDPTRYYVLSNAVDEPALLDTPSLYEEQAAGIDLDSLCSLR